MQCVEIGLICFSYRQCVSPTQLHYWRQAVSSAWRDSSALCWIQQHRHRHSSNPGAKLYK